MKAYSAKKIWYARRILVMLLVRSYFSYEVVCVCKAMLCYNMDNSINNIIWKCILFIFFLYSNVILKNNGSWSESVRRFGNSNKLCPHVYVIGNAFSTRFLQKVKLNEARIRTEVL